MSEQLKNLLKKRATFGMGCFWAGDALFGVIPGVITTLVGYSGGTKASPVYRNLGDHTEVIDIEYDPQKVSYTQLLELFWNNHEYGLTTKVKTQYASLILYHDEEQQTTADKSLKNQRSISPNIQTVMKPFDKFYPAEDYHQKYRLQQHPFLMKAFKFTSNDLKTAPEATKLNGYVAGAATIQQFNQDPLFKNIPDNVRKYLEKCITEQQKSGLYC